MKIQTLSKLQFFGPKGDKYPTPHAVIELHVEQDDKLEKKGIDLGVVEAIASPVRYEVAIGDSSLEPDKNKYPGTKYAKITVAGKANHSGATPMGDDRADGLVALSYFMSEMLSDPRLREAGFSIGDLTVDTQAINKIPGKTSAIVRLNQANTPGTDDTLNILSSEATAYNDAFNHISTKFDENPFAIEEIQEDEARVFF